MSRRPGEVTADVASGVDPRAKDFPAEPLLLLFSALPIGPRSSGAPADIGDLPGPDAAAAGAGWRSAGPAGAHGLAVSTADEGLSAWLATEQGQVFHSRDGGRRWSRTRFGGPAGAGWTETLAADPSQPAAAWASPLGGALYRTEDHGGTWQEVWSESPVRAWSSIHAVTAER